MWAGLLGAIPAAVLSAAVAAWVAVTVLNRSNAHQTRLATEQLQEQREEAVRVRERAALAEVVFAIEGLYAATLGSRDETTRHFSLLLAAMARWRIELGEGETQIELVRYAGMLLKLASMKKDSDNTPRENETNDDLLKAISTLSLVALKWPHADVSQRIALQMDLTELRTDLEARNEFDGSSLPS